MRARRVRGGAGCPARGGFAAPPVISRASPEYYYHGRSRSRCRYSASWAADDASSKRSMSARRASGLVEGEKRRRGLPSRSTRNLVKFHFMEEPSPSERCRFRYVKTGSADRPLTLTFA